MEILQLIYDNFWKSIGLLIVICLIVDAWRGKNDE